MRSTCITILLLVTLLAGCMGNTASPATEQEFFGVVEEGKLDAVRAGLDAHPDWVRSTAHRWEVPPLAIACDRGHTEIAALLLQRGAEVNAFNPKWGWRPVHEAAAQGHVEIVRMLIDHGADLNVTIKEGLTPLFLAALNGHRPVVDLLLAHGSSVTTRGPEGSTLLHVAAARGDADLAGALLAKGADAGAKTSDGRTPLFQAGSKAVAELLIAKGAAVNVADAYGRTPLFLAALFGNTDVAAVLIDKGADVNAADSKGTKPLDLAVAEGQKATAALLGLKGAKAGAGLVGHDGPPATRVRIGPRGQVFVNDRPTIPLGPWQQPQRLFEYHRHLGMNCMIWPPSGALNDESSTAEYVRPAKALGLGVILQYRKTLVGEPGVWGWIGGGWPVAEARQKYEFLRLHDPEHLIQVNFGGHGLVSNKDLDDYRVSLPYVDSVVTHVWPEMLEGQPRNLRNVALLVDHLRALCKDRPRGEVSIWPDLNPHLWFEKKRAGGMRYAEPTRQELRFQVWLALIHGADGICYFPISFDPFVSSQIPSQNEDELMLINAQVQRFAAVLCAEESPRAITVSGDAKDGIVDLATRRLDGADYVFVLNGTAAPQTVTLKVDGLGTALSLHDAITDQAIPMGSSPYSEGLNGLDLRIWKLVPAMAGTK